MNKFEDIRAILSSTDKTLEEKLKAVKRNAILSSPREVEAITSWFVEAYQNEVEENKKQTILETLDLILLNNGASILSYNNVSTLVKFVKSNAYNVQNCNFSKVVFETILKLPAIKPYLKQNDKEFTEIFSILIVNINDSTDVDLLNVLISYINALTNEKAITNFIKKSIKPIAIFCSQDVNTGRHEKFVEVLKNILFKKHLELFRNNLKIGFEKIVVINERDNAFMKALFKNLEGNNGIDSKIGIVKLIFEAAVSSDDLEDLELLKLAVFIFHILGVNELLSFTGPEELSPLENIELTLEKLTIWNTVLDILSRRTLNLSLEICQQPALQWFRANTSLVLKQSTFTDAHINSLTALIAIDAAIVEPFMANIFAKIYANEESLLVDSYQMAYERFLMACMKIFIRLQRVNKLIARILPGILSISSAMDVGKLLPASFLESLSTVTTILPSTQCLSLVDILLNHLQTCVDNYQDNKMNATLLQCIGQLLCTILTASRLLCYSLPRKVMFSFMEYISRCKDLLSRFGATILSRKHDRLVMQTFMRICHVWGEMNTLVSIYGMDDVPPLLPDTAPSDLSQTLPFLTGDQWNIITERVANFGDHKCNQLLMKLLVQKIRLCLLAGSVSCVGTAKYLLERHKASVLGVKVTAVMTPEEFGIVLNALPLEKAKAFLEILYQSRPDDRWSKNGTLLENRKYVKYMFEVAISESLKAVSKDKIPETLKSLHFELSKVAADGFFGHDNLDDLRESLNGAFVSRERAVISARHVEDNVELLSQLPFEYVVQLGGNVLTIVTAAMVLLNHESIVPIFERLLLLTKNPESCFNVGLCIDWLMKNITNKNIRGPIVEQMVIRSTSTQMGMKQFKAYVKTLRGEESLLNLEAQVIIHNAIRKCWRTGSDERTKKHNDKLAKQRRKLNRGLHSCLESAAEGQTSDWVLLDAYAIELFRVEREGSVDALVALNFDGYLKKAISGLQEDSSGSSDQSQSCLNFITTILKCSKALRLATKNNDLVFSIWQQLKALNCPTLWQHFCNAASDEEFTKIIKDVLNQVQMSLVPPDHEKLKWENNGVFCNSYRPLFIKLGENKNSRTWSDHYVQIWTLFMQNSKDAKLRCCCDAVSKLICRPQNIIPNNSSSQSLLTWLRFLHFIVTHRNIPIRTELEDYVLDVILAAPYDDKSFFSLFTVQVDILCGLIASKKVPILRKVPLIFQAFRRLLNWLLKMSNTKTDLSPDEISSVALAAFHLEKWVGLFIRRREEFRVVPLFLADVINSMGNVTVYPSAKMHLNNIVFSLLGVSDEQTVKFLLRTLPPGCQQVFTNLHAEFQKFHKYKGKI